MSVGPGFVFGDRSTVWAPRSLSIGSNVSIGSDVRIEVDGVIGDGNLLANGCGVVGRTDHRRDQVGSSIFSADRVSAHHDLSRPVLIGSDVWIGYRAVILSGISIGDSAIVGAGAVVASDVAPNTIVAGNPAVVVGTRFGHKELETHWRLLTEAGVRLGLELPPELKP